MVQQILPFTLTPQQHQAISTWAAANSQSQPHQYRLMQSLLNGLTNPSSEYPAMAGEPFSSTNAVSGSGELQTVGPPCQYRNRSRD